MNTQSKITEGLMLCLKAATDGGRRERSRREETVSLLYNRDLFLCINLCTDFLPLMLMCGAVGESELLKFGESIFSQRPHLP